MNVEDHPHDINSRLASAAHALHTLTGRRENLNDHAAGVFGQDPVVVHCQY